MTDPSLLEAHDWLYLDVIDKRQSVKCRRCGKLDSYRLDIGYKPEPPRSPCEPSELPGLAKLFNYFARQG